MFQVTKFEPNSRNVKIGFANILVELLEAFGVAVCDLNVLFWSFTSFIGPELFTGKKLVVQAGEWFSPGLKILIFTQSVE